MNKAQKGFTLIELMIVIAIIGILAAIAIPQYQDYVTRSKVTEGLSLVQAPETAVAETYQSFGHMPVSGNATAGNSFGLPMSASIQGKYIKSVLLSTATNPLTITITYNASVGGGVASGNALVMTAVTGTASVAWVCGNATVTANNKPVTGTGTTVPSKYLPSNCRP
ncbi:MAG: pilin [Candidatus Saccharimonadales bacterium]